MIPKRHAVKSASSWSIVILLGTALFLAACAGTPTPIFISEVQATQTAQPPAATLAPSVPEARLQIGVATIAGLNPMAIPDPATEAVQALIYETLVGYDSARELRPVLAAGMPFSSENGLTWTVDIQPGISIHDGTLLDGPLVAAALQACLDTPAQDDASLALVAFRNLVTEVSAEGMQVVIHLRLPFAFFPELLAEQSLAISNGPGIGSGPFVVTSTTTSGLALDAFSSYHEGVPPITGVDVRTYADEPDPSVALADALGATTLDIAIGDGLVGPGGFQTWMPFPVQAKLLLNTSVAPFDQALVRDALRQVATPGVAGREALASAGLPDAFDLLVWNTQDRAIAEPLLAAALDHLSANPEIVAVRTGDIVTVLRGGGGLAMGQTPPGGEGVPAAFVVAGRAGWQEAWWQLLAQDPDGEMNALASSPVTSPAQAVVRDAVQGLATTSGGWPRVTARTVITPAGLQ